jgi:hypothetical protein
VEGLVLEAALQLAQLGDEVLEAVVLQRDARVVGQRAEEREVVAVEAAHGAAVRDQEGADHARLARERGEHGALHAAAGQGRVEERIGQRALEQPRGRVAVDERVQGDRPRSGRRAPSARPSALLEPSCAAPPSAGRRAAG